MKTRTGMRRLLSLLLSLAMVLTMVPAVAMAADETYTLTTTTPTAGKEYVICAVDGTDYYALTNKDVNATTSTASKVTVSNGKITSPSSDLVWTTEVGTYNSYSGIAFKSGNYLHLNSSKIRVTTSCQNGTFTFYASETGFTMCGNQNNRWLTFKDEKFGVSSNKSEAAVLYFFEKDSGDVPTAVNTPEAIPGTGSTVAQGETVTLSCTTEDAAIYYTLNGSDPVGTASDTEFLYAEADKPAITGNAGDSVTLKAIAVKGENRSDVVTFTYTIESDTPDPSISTIAEALAGATGTEFTVEGVVTCVDGQNIYLQDATGGICVRMASKPEDITLGETIIGTGSKTVYRGMPQLGSGTYEKSSGMTLTAKETTIGELTTADICTYVKLTGLEVTEVFDNNGAYSNPNITVKDSAGKTIQIYKAVVGKTDGSWDVKVGDKVDVTAAVGINNTTLQLRNTLASEITPHVEQENHIVTDLSELTDGAKVVIFNPANMRALSQNYTGYYNLGTPVTAADGKLAGYGATEIWTVGVNSDGSYTFSTADGKKFSMGTSYTSTPLDDVNPNWKALPAATADCFYIQNSARGNYVEWYASKGNWSSYTSIGSNEDLFAQQFYLVVKEEEQPATGGLPKAGDQVVIYNVNAEGVLALQDDNESSPSITNASAVLTDGKVAAENGGLVFTVEKNGEYYRFKNETFGYLCSNGTGNNAFYSQEASEDADWTLNEGKKGGFFLESRTAKYNGKYSQYLEYYAGSYKTYSMYDVTDYDIYEFVFYPCANENLTAGVVNKPAVDFGSMPDAYAGSDYTFTFIVETVFGISGTLTVKVGETELFANADSSYTIPAALVTGESLTITVTGEDTKGTAISGTATITVKDEPVISDVIPAAGTQTGSDKRPVISASVSNAGENPDITMTINGEVVNATYSGGKVSYTPASDMTDGRVSVTVTVKRTDGKSASKSWNFTVGTAAYQLYFGQLHSHTTYSDGSGTLDSALEYVKNLPESANVDFVAFTDHSNYFDKSGAANPEGALYDMSLASEYSQGVWAEYKGKVADFNASQNDVIALGGFEMTWSGGPGHINTWNTAGIVSRNNTTLNNKTGDAGLKAYYALLSQSEGADSISQLNHPGSTFGTFADFAYYDALIDSRVYLVEVGNGEGAIGAGGYYPSYEYYTMALDKGWHVAPTNNQDNHKGKWGNANDARDVILTDDFSEKGLYNAIRQYRVYATEDKNLEIGYTVNDQLLGSIIAEVPEKLNISVTVNDPDSSDSISKVEVIVNSGKVAYTWNDPTELATGDLTVELDPDYSYYYIRVTEGDGDLAVTAPVWVGEALKLGISSVECGTSTPVTGEELTLTTTLFNSEVADATVKSITYTTNGSAALGTDTTGYTVPASGTLTVDFKYTPDVAKVMTVKVTVVMEQDGKEYTFTKDIELDILNADSMVYIGIDASHYNEYVAGNYKDSMGNFSELASGYSVRTVELKTSAELIAACSNSKYKALILTAPSRRLAAAQSDPKTYSADELAAITEFNANGGMVILAGWSDNYEAYADIQNNKDILHMAATQNAVLEALGSSLRISDDATYDDVRSAADSVEKWRLYFSAYGDSFLTDGVIFDAEHPFDKLYTERFSHYGGASVYAVDANGDPTSTLPTTVIPVVYGHESTYSVDVDKDGLGGDTIPKYAYTDGTNRLMVMATEQLDGKGLIIVSGAAFLSNFEVQATISDSGAEKNYSNYKICENLVQFINPVTVTDIADVRAQTEAGYKYTIEGVVTSNASGYDKDTAFFDCIYVQDATGGICCFPVAGNFKIGDVVRVTGTTDFYQGEPELQVTSIEVIGAGDASPIEVTAAQINDRSVEGSLVTLKGTVVSFEEANGLVQTIMVRDAAGNVARVFIDGYITTAKDVENLKVGCSITVTGLASYDDTFNAPEGPFPRIRIRNRADILCTENTNPVYPVIPVNPSKPSEPTEPEPEKFPFVDVVEGNWYYDAVYYAWENGLLNGVFETKFAPTVPMSRAMLATTLYRLAGEPGAGETSFADVTKGAWYYEGVSWAASAGIVNGYGDGTFGSDDLITREQAVVMLFRFCESMGIDVSARADLSGYPDSDRISAYAREAMEWAVAIGVITGRDTGIIDPAGNANRAELAQMLMRFCEKVLKK